MMWLKQRIFKISLLFLMFFVVASHAQADEKRLTINFDKNNICCIMNKDMIASELKKLKGVNSARFKANEREISLYFEPLKIKMKTIVEKVSEVTQIQKQFIFIKTYSNLILVVFFPRSFMSFLTQLETGMAQENLAIV